MLGFLDTVLGFITSAWQWFINFILMLFTFVEVLGNSLQLPLQLVSIMPWFLSSAVLVVVALAVIKTILGR